MACSSMQSRSQNTHYGGSNAEQSKPKSVAGERKVIWKARQELEVDSPIEAAAEIKSWLKTNAGFVERSANDGENSATVVARIPANKLHDFLDSMALRHDEISRKLSSNDVTLEYIDLEARLKNAIALRDRMRELLDKTTSLDQILRIEKELSQAQSTVDKLETSMQILGGKLALSTADIKLVRKRVPGPIVLVWNASGWLLSKLFFLD